MGLACRSGLKNRHFVPERAGICAAALALILQPTSRSYTPRG
jgi:hypothetical protein